jgi:hypothetical protein
MTLDGVHPDVQPKGNPLVAKTPRDELRDFPFACRQAMVRIGPDDFRADRPTVRGFRWFAGSACGSGFDRSHESQEVRAMVDDSVRTRSDEPTKRIFVGPRRQDEDPGRRRRPVQPSEDGLQVRHRIVVVDEEYSRPELQEALGRVLSGARAECDDAQAQPRTQRPRQHVANQRRSRRDGDVHGCDARPSIESPGRGARVGDSGVHSWSRMVVPSKPLNQLDVGRSRLGRELDERGEISGGTTSV